MQPKTIVSSKKIRLSSEFLLFDLLPVKKYHECNVRIPQTIILQKGFIRQWLFNSKKHSHHPILKKKRQNMSPIGVIKSFCNKLGYQNAIAHCTTISDVRDAVKIALREQKDYDFVKDKKVIEIMTITNETLSLTLLDFLDYSAQNKYSDQGFYEKWKLIQERVSFAKIDEHYEVQSTRHNHVLQSKCQKIIAVNTTQNAILSTELNDDEYKKVSPGRNFEITETKNMEGYKFFDTFLNKKFFQMSADLVEFIEKNFKCIVENIKTKFVINKDREPHLAGIYDLDLKPAKKIADMKEYQIQKEKGYLKIQEYLKYLEIYIAENVEKFNYSNNNRNILQRKKQCKGKFCKVLLKEVTLPALLQQKLKLPSLSSNAKLVPAQQRDAYFKRQRRVIELLKENDVVESNYERIQDSSSEYETSGDEDTSMHFTGKLKQIKVCHNCFIFYFHANRFFEIDPYGNLTEKKIPIAPSKTKNTPQQKEQKARTNFKTFSEKKEILNLPPGSSEGLRREKSKKNLSPIKHLRPTQSSKTMKFQPTIQKSQPKLQPLSKKQKLTEINAKGKTLLTISKTTNPRTSQFRKPMIDMNWQKKPENLNQAIDQILMKLSVLSSSNREQFIYYAKKYYKDNLPQPIDRRSFSSFYVPHLYQFMNNSPISIHPKHRIKKRPEMSLKRLSQLTDYPEIVSKSEFVFDTLIVNEQTTIPFCLLSTKVVNPENLKQNMPFENIFFVNDIFDSFIEYISVAKQLLQDEECFNKRIILFNYPGQSHTIYNQENVEGLNVNFATVMDKLIYRLSGARGELKFINLKKDSFKFCAFGYGSFLLSNYLGSYYYYFSNIKGIFLVNGFTKLPEKYLDMLRNLLELYGSQDPTAENQAHLFYNKAINSSETDNEELEHKAGLNPIRASDRAYLIQSILHEYQESKTPRYSFQCSGLENVDNCPVIIVYGKSNAVIPKESSLLLEKYGKNQSVSIKNRIYLQLEGGHDIFSDNYYEIFTNLALFARK